MTTLDRVAIWFMFMAVIVAEDTPFWQAVYPCTIGTVLFIFSTAAENAKDK